MTLLLLSEGHYMFIETSYLPSGNFAQLVSPYYSVKKFPKGACFNFWYHMYGIDIETLNIYVELSQYSTVGITEYDHININGRHFSIMLYYYVD